MNISTEEFYEYFNETRQHFLLKNASKDYKERITKQLEQVESILLNSYVVGKKYAIITAPTGSGKSMYSLIFADFFERIKDENQTYILTSNKFLQEQQLETAQKFKEENNTALLKGQSNYTCDVNGLNFEARDCAHLSFAKASVLPCADKCEYLVQRRNCQERNSMITSYHYFLTIMNYAYENLGDGAGFWPRACTIMDEAHKLENIVQEMFAFSFGEKNMLEIREKHKNIKKYVENSIFTFEKDDNDNNISDIAGISKEKYEYHLDVFDNFPLQDLFFTDNDSKKSIYILMQQFHEALSIIYSDIKGDIVSKFPSEKNQTLDQKKIVALTKKLASTILNIDLSLQIFKQEGYDTMIVSTTNDWDDFYKRKFNHAVIKCSKIGPLMHRRVFKYTNFTILMSATLGVTETFGLNLGIPKNDMYCVDIPSDFNFEKSPIILIKPNINLSYKIYNEHINSAFRAVLRIVNLHENNNCILHVTKKIGDELKNSIYKHTDMRFYNNDEEKIAYINEMKSNTKSFKRIILVGHNLVEGVSFDDDMARVNILIKTPYPSLADNYNKQMLALNTSWYNNKTIMETQQAIGRTNRHKNDYSSVYLVDSNFVRLMTGNGFADYITNRFTERTLDYLQTDMTNVLLGNVTKSMETKDERISKKSNTKSENKQVDYIDDIPF